MIFDRAQAGVLLAQKIQDEMEHPSDYLVLSLPRGGVVVGEAMAQRLGGEHDVIITKKIPAPSQPELALGAIGENPESIVLNERLLADLQVSATALAQMTAQVQAEVERRLQQFRGDRPKPNLNSRLVVIADDGVATGASIRAAIRQIRLSDPKQLIVAVPVLPKSLLPILEAEADRVIFLEAPTDFFAVGQFYEAFPQVTDEEVIRILRV